MATVVCLIVVCYHQLDIANAIEENKQAIVKLAADMEESFKLSWLSEESEASDASDTPSWTHFIEAARTFDRKLTVRMCFSHTRGHDRVCSLVCTTAEILSQAQVLLAGVPDAGEESPRHAVAGTQGRLFDAASPLRRSYHAAHSGA